MTANSSQQFTTHTILVFAAVTNCQQNRAGNTTVLSLKQAQRRAPILVRAMQQLSKYKCIVSPESLHEPPTLAVCQKCHVANSQKILINVTWMTNFKPLLCGRPWVSPDQTHGACPSPIGVPIFWLRHDSTRQFSSN